MREIKFRAWDGNEKKIIYNGFAVAPTSPSWSPFRLEDWLNPEDTWGDYQYIDFTCFYGIENFILMQYTGLKDKNGKEVYEGDIVRILGGVDFNGMRELDETCQIIFSFGSFKPVDNKKIHYDFGMIDDIEIIGNIYENPELIK